MPDKPPPDHADHAEDFSHRYAQEMDYLTGDRMTELGIPTNKIGSRVPGQGRATFIPHERSGGGNDPARGLTLDSGVFNPDLLGTLPGNQEWAKARLRDRVDAAIAHEHEEARRGGSHVEALKHAPDTELPDPGRSPAHPAGHEATGGAFTMIHDLTIGHLDPDAIPNRLAIPLKQLDEEAVARVLAEFPGLKLEWHAGYLIAPWHGREDGERGEAFAARLQAETGCLVADRRNGRIVELGQKVKERAAG